MFNTRKYKNRLASEYDALIMIEAKHAGDARFRLAIAAILAALLYVRGFPAFALACLIGLYFVELLQIMSIKAFKKLPLSREAQVLQLTSLVVVGVSVWAALSAAMWLTDNPVLQVYGFAMLIGINVHIGMMYTESRFLTISALTPLTATVVGMLVYYHGYAQQSVTDNPMLSGLCFLLLYQYNSTFATVRTNEKLRHAVETSEKLAKEDALTGLYNRRHFIMIAGNAWKEKKPYYLALIDLDGFKALNDAYGHSTGDAVLKKIANRLTAWEPAFAAARLGGDEFSVMIDLSDSHVSPVSAFHQLRNLLSKDIHHKGHTVSVGASIGYARIDGNFERFVDLANGADVAMYSAKHSRVGVLEFDDNLVHCRDRRSNVARALRENIRDRKLRAFVQPIVDAQTRKVRGYELLCRWPETDTLSNVAPNEFIPIAREFGLLNKILWATLEKALPVVSNSDLVLFVNVDPQQVTAPDFGRKLLATLQRYGVKPSQICLEVTEQVSLSDPKIDLSQFQTIKELGCKIAVDDFGTGYASIEMLIQLPIDIIKIDQAFLNSTGDKRVAENLLSAVLTVSKRNGLVTVMEGVESELCAVMVKDRGCDLIQGYHTGRPVSVDDILFKREPVEAVILAG